LLVRGDGRGTSGEYFRSAQLGSQYFEQIVCAFVDPVLALHFDPDDAWFAKLVLREAGDPSNQDRPVLKVLFDPMAREFIDAFREALPGKPDGFYQWAYLFSVGALTQGASEDRVRDLTRPTWNRNTTCSVPASPRPSAMADEDRWLET